MRKATETSQVTYADLETYYFFRLMNVALAQFTYENLPDTCDRRYMELVALTRGSVAIYKPEGCDFYLSTGYMPFETCPNAEAVNWYTDIDVEDIAKCTEQRWEKYFKSANTYDVYGNPTQITGLGFNGETTKPADGEWGVFFDNMTREPLVLHLRKYAQMLAECHMTFRMNLRQQNKPYVITSSRNKQLSLKQFFKALFTFEPVVEVSGAFDLENTVNVLDLRVEYKGTELLENLKEIWNQALNMLGISTQSTKKERLITGEIGMDRQADLITMNSRLLNRKEFWEKFNKEHGTNVQVRMSSADVDFESVFGQQGYDIATFGSESSAGSAGSAGSTGSTSSTSSTGSTGSTGSTAWSDADLALLNSNMTAEEIAAATGHTVAAVRKQRERKRG